MYKKSSDNGSGQYVPLKGLRFHATLTKTNFFYF